LIGNALESYGFAVAAWILAAVGAVPKGRFTWMITTMINLSSNELFIAMRTSEFLETSEHFPEDFRPWHLLLPQVHNEFVNVPKFVILMF